MILHSWVGPISPTEFSNELFVCAMIFATITFSVLLQTDLKPYAVRELYPKASCYVSDFKTVASVS